VCVLCVCCAFFQSRPVRRAGRPRRIRRAEESGSSRRQRRCLRQRRSSLCPIPPSVGPPRAPALPPCPDSAADALPDTRSCPSCGVLMCVCVRARVGSVRPPPLCPSPRPVAPCPGLTRTFLLYFAHHHQNITFPPACLPTSPGHARDDDDCWRSLLAAPRSSHPARLVDDDDGAQKAGEAMRPPRFPPPQKTFNQKIQKKESPAIKGGRECGHPAYTLLPLLCTEMVCASAGGGARARCPPEHFLDPAFFLCLCLFLIMRGDGARALLCVRARPLLSPGVFLRRMTDHGCCPLFFHTPTESSSARAFACFVDRERDERNE